MVSRTDIFSKLKKLPEICAIHRSRLRDFFRLNLYISPLMIYDVRDSMKKSIFLPTAIMVLAVILVAPAYADSPKLRCDFESSCSQSQNEVAVLKIASYDRDHREYTSHAGIYTSSYNTILCCKLTHHQDPNQNLSIVSYDYAHLNNCNPDFMGRVISLSRDTNAHVAEYGQGAYYQNNLCLSSTAGNITCGYQMNAGGKCTDDYAKYECLASISGANNAHIGECNDREGGTESLKICCIFKKDSITSPPPFVSDLDIVVGETGMFVFNITNARSDPDIYALSLSGSPSKIGYWSWFSGHRYDREKNNMSVTLEPGETANFAVLVFGGEAMSSGSVTVNIKSALTGETTEILKPIAIRFANDGLFTDTPEFGWLWYGIIGIAAAVILL